MTSKLRVKVGDVEVDYEGAEEFLKQGLPELLKNAVELRRVVDDLNSTSKGGNRVPPSEGGGSNGIPTLTTGAIAGRLGVKSGSELLKAAAAHLALVKKVVPFSRQQLLAEMQTATSYYKKSQSNNLTRYIDSALQKDGFLSETATNAYALNASASADLEAKLADA